MYIWCSIALWVGRMTPRSALSVGRKILEGGPGLEDKRPLRLLCSESRRMDFWN